jgi:hypothetical protein
MWFGHPPYEEAGCLGVIAVVVAIPITLFLGLREFLGMIVPVCFFAPFVVYQLHWDLERWRERMPSKRDDTDSSSRRDGGP